MAGTVYTVASGKGGVGKTTTSVNLAVALWQEGKAVALVDADIGMANLAAVLGLEPERTLHDVLAGGASVDDAIVEAQGGNLLVLAGDRSLESFADADPRELRAAVAALAERCDYVVVDTGAGLSYEDVLPLGMADGVVLVTTPDPAAFGDTRKTMEVADLLGAPVRGLVVTRAVEDTDAEAIAGEIGAELLGKIPEDTAVMASTVAGNPLESHAPDSDAAAAYRELAATILEGDPEWLEANPRQPPTGVVAGGEAGGAEPGGPPTADPDEATAAASDEATAEDDGSELAAGEAWAAANEASDDDSGTTDIGDIVAEVGEVDEAWERDESPETDDGGEVSVVPGRPATDRDSGARDAAAADEEPGEAQEEAPTAGEDLGEALAAGATDEPDDAAESGGDEGRMEGGGGTTAPEAGTGGTADPDGAAGADEEDGDGAGGDETADAEATDDEERVEPAEPDDPTESAGSDGLAEPGADVDRVQGPGEVGDSDDDGDEPDDSAGSEGQDEDEPAEPGPEEAGEVPEGADADEGAEDDRRGAPDEPEEGAPEDDEEPADGDSEGDDEEDTERRGGVRGWLGRLFG